MHIDIPDDLWKKLSDKAASVYPTQGSQSPYKVLGTLIQNFVDSDEKSEILMGTKQGKALSLTQINDEFFDAFIKGAQKLYPDSEKPEVDFILDCIASLVDTDKRVILLHSVDATHYDKLVNNLATNLGGGSDSIYLLLTKLLVKAFTDSLVTTSFSQDKSLFDAEDTDKIMMVFEGVPLKNKVKINPEVMALMLNNLVNIVSEVDATEFKAFNDMLGKVFGFEGDKISVFIKELIKEHKTGKVLLANISRAPITSALKEAPKDPSKYTIILKDVPVKALQKLTKIQQQMAESIDSQTKQKIDAYKIPGIGFFIYLLDLLNVADESKITSSFNNEEFDKIIEGTSFSGNKEDEKAISEYIRNYGSNKGTPNQ